MDGEKCTLLKNKTMTDIEFEQILHRMSKEDLDKWNRMKGLPSPVPWWASLASS